MKVNNLIGIKNTWGPKVKLYSILATESDGGYEELEIFNLPNY